MKLLRRISGTAGVFFPIGRPEKKGTCEHATTECEKFCCAKWGYDYDEEYRVSEEDKELIYQEFLNKPMLELCVEILKEMGELQTNILSWFVSGDCMTNDIDRLSGIMRILSNYSDIYQHGFTKNPDLFYHIDGLKRVHIVRTIEHKDLIGDGYAKIFALCNYNHGKTELYLSTTKYVGSCGSTEYVEKKVRIAANCATCLRLKVGCFTNTE